jgi:inorganic pyrophosphatase
MLITAIIEMPQGTSLKYEVDKQTGQLLLDRPLNQSIPYNYGFIPKTLCGDGDPLDIFVVCDEPIYPLTKLNVEIVGALHCTDNGDLDDKIVAHLVGDTRPHMFGLRLIQNYLETYKKDFQVHEIWDKDMAVALYLRSLVEQKSG